MTEATLQTANELQKDMSVLRGYISVLDRMIAISGPQNGMVLITHQEEVVPIPYEIIQSVAVLISGKIRTRLAEREKQFMDL